MRSLSPRWRTLFEGSVSKHHEFSECNEDKYRLSDERQLCVLSDGATESFNSSLWADILVGSWLSAKPRRNYLGWLRSAIWEYESKSELARMSWSQEAAFARGSFASLLAVETEHASLLRITAVGDSIAVLVINGMIQHSFPYKSAEQFRSRPHLLSTIFARNTTPFLINGVRAIRAGMENGPCHVVWRIESNDHVRVLCMTDAIGEWLLADCDPTGLRLKALLSLEGKSSESDFSELVDRERASGAMRQDDTTLIILGGNDHAESSQS